MSSSSPQPIIMAHHPQIAYAAQQTASQFAQQFNNNNSNKNNSSLLENSNTSEQIPANPCSFYPVTTNTAGQMYYPIYANMPKKIEE